MASDWEALAAEFEGDATALIAEGTSTFVSIIYFPEKEAVFNFKRI